MTEGAASSAHPLPSKREGGVSVGGTDADSRQAQANTSPLAGEDGRGEATSTIRNAARATVALWPSIILFLVAFGADRLHKFLQISVLGWQGGEFVPVNAFFNYVLVWNTGISYSLFNTLPVWVLGIGMLVAIVALGVWWWRAQAPLIRAGLALCIGGALSNALDRWVYGGVADFFHFHYGPYSFYIFNLADTAITFGVILLVLDFLGLGRRRNT